MGISQNLLVSASNDEVWGNNLVRPILESYRKVQNQMEENLEERILRRLTISCRHSKPLRIERRNNHE